MNQVLDTYRKYLIFCLAMEHTVDGFAPLRIKRVVRETADAVSLFFDVPEPFSQHFHYQPGQFLTLRVQVGGQEHRRCYSMSSSPMGAEDLRITVKRDPGGVVSNWLNDTACPGDEIHAAPPEAASSSAIPIGSWSHSPAAAGSPRCTR